MDPVPNPRPKFPPSRVIRENELLEFSVKFFKARCRVRVCWGCTEYDVVCITSEGKIAVVEVKSIFNEFNRLAVENQLYSRLCVADEVWLAVPLNDAFFTVAVIPSWCDVLGVGEGGDVEVVRPAGKVVNVCVNGLEGWRW